VGDTRAGSTSGSTRAVGQKLGCNHADRQNKPIIELRPEFKEPEFPGFLNFMEPLSKMEALPKAIEVLKHATGVYLLTCPRTKEQYVGAAYGVDGFWHRWVEYVMTGHGVTWDGYLLLLPPRLWPYIILGKGLMRGTLGRQGGRIPRLDRPIQMAAILKFSNIRDLGKKNFSKKCWSENFFKSDSLKKTQLFSTKNGTRWIR